MQVQTAPSPIERILRRDRLLMGLGLAVLTVLAWGYLLRDAAMMRAMASEAQMHIAMGMADPRTWGAGDWFGLFVMWAVMMAAMMLPSAAPVMLLVLAVYRRRGDVQARAAAGAFVAGYLIVWTAFSVLAAAGQILLHRVTLLGADMRFTSALVSAAILAIAGIYQWLPIKNTCLTQCQSPLGFLSQHWRDGVSGGLTMGLRHGLFCVGCCWMLMALLFIVGVMNLFWVAALAALVLIEKLVRAGAAVSRAAGVAMVVWAAYLLISQ